MDTKRLYEEDFVLWSKHQVEALRAAAHSGSNQQLDWDHLAEEIEDLGRSERDAVRSQIRRIIEHFLKLAYSPAEQPRFDWMASIVEARATLGDKISATLRRDAEAMLPKLYHDGRRLAELSLRACGEDKAAEGLPQSCPYSLDDICREDWYPERLGGKP